MQALRALIFIVLVSVVVWGVLQGVILKRQLLALDQAEKLSTEQLRQQEKVNDLIKRYKIDD